MQLSVGSQWTDTQNQEFQIDDVETSDTETWVAYTRVKDQTSYRCLAEAFTHRFKEKIQ